MRRTFVYIISSFLLCFVVSTATAQKKKQIIIPPDSIPWLNGFTVHVDISPLVTSTLIDNSTYSSEAGIQLDLKHKIFPTIELGYAGADKTTSDNIGYKTNGLFGRIGVDFNLRKKKKDSKPTNNLFMAGLRLGMSNFNYNINNVTITDTYWGGSTTFDYPVQNTTKLWYEFVVGVQVEVFKNFYMGWTVRDKNLLGSDVPGAEAPWYIPGFGINNGTSWGFNYTVGYHFFGNKKNIRNKTLIPTKKK